LLAHVILWDESFNISWWSLPEQIADILTVVVIAGCCYFLYRRLTDPTVKYLTSISVFYSFRHCGSAISHRFSGLSSIV
jgi:hypothetical protein